MRERGHPLRIGRAAVRRGPRAAARVRPRHVPRRREAHAPDDRLPLRLDLAVEHHRLRVRHLLVRRPRRGRGPILLLLLRVLAATDRLDRIAILVRSGAVSLRSPLLLMATVIVHDRVGRHRRSRPSRTAASAQRTRAASFQTFANPRRT